MIRATKSQPLLPPMPQWMRFCVAGLVLACFAYVLLELNRIEKVDQVLMEELEAIVPVPELDTDLLSQVDESSPAARVKVETEPLRHLLHKAIDVGPTVAAALNMPSEPVPVAQVREHPDEWRRRWLWYEGKLVAMSSSSTRHPIDGYTIFEAVIELPDGDHVVACYSVPPAEPLGIGDWARVEGFLLKLRDYTYGVSFQKAPMLVGRTIQRDYADWPPITELDPSWFDQVHDESFFPGEHSMRTVDEDQCEALWRIGAYARDSQGQRSSAEWRAIEPLSAYDPYERLIAGKVQRGEPMRVFGSLIRRKTIAAPANPANIKFWTAVWLQVAEFGGQLVPIWVPDRVPQMAPRTELEVRGFYYRWFVYDTQHGKRVRVPLVVAAKLDRLPADETMQALGTWMGGIAIFLLTLLFWGQRRSARSSLEHSRQMDERRRRRRKQAIEASTQGG